MISNTWGPHPSHPLTRFPPSPLSHKHTQVNDKGLTTEQAAQRLAEYGPNKLPEESRNPILVYLSYMWNPLSWAMEAAAIIAIALLDYVDFALILCLLIVNATISYVEEANADKAIKALTSALAPKAKVLRDATVSTIEASELVPGDIIIVRLGDIVPADIKILSDGAASKDLETPMQVDQAALTGESLPVKKYSGDVAFAGSTIKQGERHCVVYATGMNTFFGRAAALLGGATSEAHLQQIMTKIGFTCLITIGVWIVIELGVQFGHYDHECSGGSGMCPTLTNLLVIIVGGIPIAMPTVLSVTLALGAYNLAKDGAIVSRMSAVEEMAGMDILCSDKTGTLTLNKLTVDVTNCAPGEGFDVDDVLKYGALSANIVTEEPIDMVLHDSYPYKDSLWEDYKLNKFVPFNPVDKVTIAFIQEKATGKLMRVMKGAPQVVVKKAHNADAITEDATKKITEYALRGFRGLGVAVADGDGSNGTKWELVGLVPLFDPPRHDTGETIARCLEMGIRVKMITGDQLLIGKETAKQLGMGTNMFTTEELAKAKAGFELVDGHASVEDLVEQADGFAEVFPEHKFLIVKILQERKHMVGMTGDGVNDAPALKKADVGIAVAGATDAARGAADIVLTQPGLYTIVGAIIGARCIFQRMTTYSRYTVAMTFRVVFTFGLLTVIYNWYFPTILIVVLAVFNDGAMIALSKDKVTPSHLPNRWDLKSIFLTGIVYGLYLTLSSWVLFHLANRSTFFENSLGMFTLDERQNSMYNWCVEYIPQYLDENNLSDLNTDTPICDFPPYSDSSLADRCADETHAVVNVTILDQCIAEQGFMRGAMTRSMMYLQVSVSGQALVFVVRTASHSLMVVAGGLTYVAFFGAQSLATIISIFGFNGYEFPPDAIEDCQFCRLAYKDGRAGGYNPFFSNREVPLAETEATFTASSIGCTYYAVVAWVWAAIWYIGLDPIKWLMMWVLNEEGIRGRSFWAGTLVDRKEITGAAAQGISRTSVANYARTSVARASMTGPPGGPGRMSATGMARMSVTPLQRGSVVVTPGPAQAGGVPGVGGQMHATPDLLRKASTMTIARTSAVPQPK